MDEEMNGEIKSISEDLVKYFSPRDTASLVMGIMKGNMSLKEIRCLLDMAKIQGGRINLSRKLLIETKRIIKCRPKYKFTAEEKHICHKKVKWRELPEHVRRTIRKTQKATVERESRGGSLPKPSKVSGGRVSPR